jgi:hypothetical protein
VLVFGVVELEAEGNVVRDPGSGQAIWLIPDREPRWDFASPKLCQVKGIFDARDRGPHDTYVGSLHVEYIANCSHPSGVVSSSTTQAIPATSSAQKCVLHVEPARITNTPDPLPFRKGVRYIPRGILWPTQEHLKYWRGNRFNPNSWREHVRKLGEPEEKGLEDLLTGMREPSLFFLVKSGAEVYRFIWLRSFLPAVAVRIVRTPLSTLLVVRDRQGTGKYPEGADADMEIREVTPEQWKCFELQLTSARFWDLSPTVAAIGLDGADWIVEGVNNDKYHIVERWSPDLNDPFRRLSWYFMQLAVGSKDLGQSGY